MAFDCCDHVRASVCRPVPGDGVVLWVRHDIEMSHLSHLQCVILFIAIEKLILILGNRPNLGSVWTRPTGNTTMFLEFVQGPLDCPLGYLSFLCQLRRCTFSAFPECLQESLTAVFLGGTAKSALDREEQSIFIQREYHRGWFGGPSELEVEDEVSRCATLLQNNRGIDVAVQNT